LIGTIEIATGSGVGSTILGYNTTIGSGDVESATVVICTSEECTIGDVGVLTV
jgi:hypothetical protein